MSDEATHDSVLDASELEEDVNQKQVEDNADEENNSNVDDEAEDDDDDDDDSDNNSVLDRMMEAMEETIEEEATKHPAPSLDEVPALLEGLTSKEEATFAQAFEQMCNIIWYQKEFIADNLSAFDVPRLVKAAKEAPDPSQRSSLVQIVTDIADVSDEARRSMIAHIPDLMSFLAVKDTLEAYSLPRFLNELAENEPESYNTILEGAKALYAPFRDLEEDKITPADEDRIIALIQAFENALINCWSTCRKIFLQASAFDTLIIAATSFKSPAVRKVAVSCLVQVNVYSSDVEEDLLEDDGSRGQVPQLIVSLMFGLVEEENEDVSSTAIGFLNEDRDELSTALLLELYKTTESVLPSLVRRVGKKALHQVGIPAEYALLKVYETDDGKEVVHTGFKKVWEDEEITREEKIDIVNGLTDSFVDLRKAAFKGGLLAFMLKSFTDGSGAVEQMTAFARLMDTDQTAGYELLQVPGMLEQLVDLFDGSAPERKLPAATILVHTLGCYDHDSQSQHADAATRLYSPNILPRLLEAFDTGDLVTANAAAKVLAAIVSEEDGTESWGYDEESSKPPPATPMKDTICTPERTLRAVLLLKHEESKVGGLALLCQFGWGNPRGYGLVKEAFEKVVPEGDVFLFSHLGGEYEGRTVWSMRARVADAAVKAGALERVEKLLEGDFDTVDARCAALEGYRRILTSDALSDDRSAGRKNKRLPVLVKKVLDDRDRKSFRSVVFMTRWLNDDDDKERKCFDVWKESELNCEETAEAFEYWLTRPSGKEVLESPDAEKLSEEEYAKQERVYNEKVREVEKEDKEFIDLVGEAMASLISILVPYAARFVGPLLRATNSWNSSSSLMTLLDTFAANEDALNTALVPAVKDLLTSGEADNNAITSWISRGASLANAFYLGGIIDYLKKGEEPDADGDVSYPNVNIQIFESLVTEIKNPDYKRAVQQAFFSSKPALGRALTTLKDADALWDAQAITRTFEAMTRDYPGGLEQLEAEEGVYPALVKLLKDHNTSCDDVATLLGRMAGNHAEELKEALQTLIGQLEPPAEGEDSEPPKGKKKPKKKKKYVPEIGLSNVLDRFEVMTKTTPEATRILFEVGAVDVARKGLADSEERQKYALKLLSALVRVDEGAFRGKIVQVVPDLGKLFNSDFEHLEELVEFTRSLIAPDTVQSLIDADLHRALFKTFTDFPTSVGNMALVIDTVRDFGETEKGREPMKEAIRESLAREDAFEWEEVWGNAHALRRLIDETEASAKLVVDAGAVDYVIRLLEGGEGNAHLFAIGGALVGSLSRSSYLPQVRTALVERGVPSKLEHGYAKCEEQLKECGDTEEDDEKRNNLKKWKETVATSLKFIQGEEVEGYEVDYFI